MPPVQPAHDSEEGVEAYFTDLDHVQAAFKRRIAAPRLDKQFLLVHGVGGVGKSSLLRMFRLICKRARVPVGLASGDEHHAESEILADWAADLAADGVPLPTFDGVYAEYRSVRARINSEVAKEQTEKDKARQQFAKSSAKAVVSSAASLIPVVGPIAGALGGVGAEALMDWLVSKGLKRTEIDLALDPADALAAAFLADVNEAADIQRIVLMLDTYEQVQALDDWVREFAAVMHPNALLVLAGREMPGVEWHRKWPGWLADAEVVHLEPMTPEVMRDLAHNYYVSQVGRQPDPVQLEKVVQFAEGLPVAVTTAVQLWIKYPSVTDFEEVEAGVLAELAKRLREGVPDSLLPLVEVAATVRYFNKEILRAVSGQADINAAYDELRRFPFTKTGKVGGEAVYRLHDSVRRFLDRRLQVDDPERHRELHRGAQAYFEAKLSNADPEERSRFVLERLFHAVLADEKSGMALAQEYAEQLMRLDFVALLRSLVSDLHTCRLSRENSRLWREYYGVRLDHLAGRYDNLLDRYQAVFESDAAEPKLQAYALCDFAEAASMIRFRRIPNILERGLAASELSLNVAPQVDSKLANNYRWQSDYYYLAYGDWTKCFEVLDRATEYFRASNDPTGQIQVALHVKGQAAVRGDWPRFLAAHSTGIQLLDIGQQQTPSYARFISHWSGVLAWMGRCEEAAKYSVRALAVLQRFELGDLTGILRDLALIRALQDRFEEARTYFDQCFQMHDVLRQSAERSTTYRWQIISFAKQRRLLEAEELADWVATIYRDSRYETALGEFYALTGLVSEQLGKYSEALASYGRSVERMGRLYHNCAAFAGLFRIQARQGNDAELPSLLARGEELALKYQYRDRLASFRLTQGHLAWAGRMPEWGSGFEAALGFYKQALTLALQYNRFLLDEVLVGRKLGTPLRPIADECRERGAEGQEMLGRLLEWWKTGMNEEIILSERSISPLPVGVSLIVAEQQARANEPGDGTPQTSVADRLAALLS